MHKLLTTTYKEIVLLSRDMGGLVILFVMPLLLIVTVTLIQDGSFKVINNAKIPILLVDQDKGSLSEEIQKNIADNDFLKIVMQKNGKDLTEAEAQNAVLKGEYKLAIILPSNLSKDLKKKVDQNVNRILGEFGLAEEEEVEVDQSPIQKKEINLYFDPTTQLSFKNAIKSSIDKMISKIEIQSIYTTFQKELGEEDTPLFEDGSFIRFKEINPKAKEKTIIPNSTQHNVPAWSLFAIFFIVIPLSINMVKEKTQGTFVRLRTQPVSYLTILGGKTMAYLAVCIIQFALMLLLGVFLLPKLGLPNLEIENGFTIVLLFVVALFAGLAAIGFGVLLGTLAKTQEQAAPFGATAVVILAAIGGVWVPVFLMPSFMQTLASFSPMNWGLNAFHDLLLRSGGFLDILPRLSLMLLFFVATTIVSIIYDKNKNTI